MLINLSPLIALEFKEAAQFVPDVIHVDAFILVGLYAANTFLRLHFLLQLSWEVIVQLILQHPRHHLHTQFKVINVVHGCESWVCCERVVGVRTERLLRKKKRH